MASETKNFKFTQDWFSVYIPFWEVILAHLKDKPIRVLEIGSFEGRSATWLMQNITTHPEANMTCVDPFLISDGSGRFDASLYERFEHNTFQWRNKITVHVGRSEEVLRHFPAHETYDFIYIDGSHHSADVLTDAILCFPLLKASGILIFDDYLGGNSQETNLEFPMIGVDAFLRTFADRLTVVNKGYQVMAVKNAVPPTYRE
jgi:predicted O-methyltransferase YrrM